MKVSKIVVLVLIVVASLAAGTALVAGYADRPDARAQAMCQGDCGACPAQCTQPCDKTACACDADQSKACAGDSSKACCPQSEGCCPEETPAAPCEQEGCGGCPMSGCARQQ